RPGLAPGVPDGAARPPRGFRARGGRLGEALARPRGRVPAQGADVRALLADRPARKDAAAARPDISARDRVAPAPALRERAAASRPARLVDRARACRADL